MDFKQAIDLLATGHKVRREKWCYDMYAVVNQHNILVNQSAYSPAMTVFRPDWQDLTATDWGVYSDAK